MKQSNLQGFLYNIRIYHSSMMHGSSRYYDEENRNIHSDIKKGGK